MQGWRIAWFHPVAGRWRLAVYEYRDRGMAEEMAAYLEAEMGMRARLVPCQAFSTGHGADG